MTSPARGRAYCRGPLKRAFDLCLAIPALIVLSPLLAILALAVAAFSGRPVFFGQERVGLGGRPFRLWKFRTMRQDGGQGLPITGAGDGRVTPVGRILRAAKLDELPQLYNVILGEMSLVGPRPEVPRFVSDYTPMQRRVLEVRPGLTDPASVRFRDEEIALGTVEETRREEFYREEILPKKLALNLQYIDRAGLMVDASLILQTLRVLVKR